VVLAATVDDVAVDNKIAGLLSLVGSIAVAEAEAEVEEEMLMLPSYMVLQ
jgi:hypothetical protein